MKLGKQVPKTPLGNRLLVAGTRLVPDSVKARLNRFLARPGSAR